MLLRTLLPSWKFFDDVGFVPHLYYRVATLGGSFGPWVPCLNPPHRKWYHFFLNPRGNLFLAHRTLVERLVGEINALEESLVASQSPHLEKSVSYQLVRELARSEILLAGIVSPFQFQFKITVVNLQQAGEQEALISTEHEA